MFTRCAWSILFSFNSYNGFVNSVERSRDLLLKNLHRFLDYNVKALSKIRLILILFQQFCGDRDILIQRLSQSLNFLSNILFHYTNTPYLSMYTCYAMNASCVVL